MTKTLEQRKIEYIKTLGKITNDEENLNIIFVLPNKKRISISPDYFESTHLSRWRDDDGELHTTGGWIQFKRFKKIINSLIKDL